MKWIRELYFGDVGPACGQTRPRELSGNNPGKLGSVRVEKLRRKRGLVISVSDLICSGAEDNFPALGLRFCEEFAINVPTAFPLPRRIISWRTPARNGSIFSGAKARTKSFVSDELWRSAIFRMEITLENFVFHAVCPSLFQILNPSIFQC